ncbi:MAG: hypothetical protein ACREBC_30735 [Pyrinomonadaceae bacterium]
MSDSSPVDLEVWALSIVAAYKVASLLVGLLFGYMGYRLFVAGIERPAGHLEASSGSRVIRVSRAAPGTFFALFGAAVIAATIFQGYNVELPNSARQVLDRLPKNPPMVTNE